MKAMIFDRTVMRLASLSLIAALGVVLPVTAARAADLAIGGERLVKLLDKGIPAGERSVEAIIPWRDRTIVITSGDRCHVLVFDAASSETREIASIPGPATVGAAALEGDDILWVGTRLSDAQFHALARSRGIQVDIRDIRALPLDGRFDTGRLYRISGVSGAKAEVRDLGTPVPNQGINSLACDAKRGKLYGFTWPLGRFFIRDIASGTTETVSYGEQEIVEHAYVTTLYQPKLPGNEKNIAGVHRYPSEVTKYRPFEVLTGRKPIAEALWVDPEGGVYTSGFLGMLIRWDPARAAFDTLAQLPAAPGRNGYNCVTALLPGGDGLLYGGDWEGYLFAWDAAKRRMLSFGKPFRAKGITGLAFSPKGDVLYGAGGGKDEGYGRLFAFDPSERTFILEIPRREGSFLYGYEGTEISLLSDTGVGAFAGDARGNLVVGQTGRVANLLVLYESRLPRVKETVAPYQEK